RWCRPTFDRDPAVAGVKRNGYAAGKSARRRFHHIRIAYRRGADDDPIDAFCEDGFDRAAVANSAAELDGYADGFPDAFDRGRIDRPACNRAVEIDNVQVFETLALKRLRLHRRI